MSKNKNFGRFNNNSPEVNNRQQRRKKGVSAPPYSRAFRKAARIALIIFAAFIAIIALVVVNSEPTKSVKPAISKQTAKKVSKTVITPVVDKKTDSKKTTKDKKEKDVISEKYKDYKVPTRIILESLGKSVDWRNKEVIVEYCRIFTAKEYTILNTSDDDRSFITANDLEKLLKDDKNIEILVSEGDFLITQKGFVIEKDEEAMESITYPNGCTMVFRDKKGHIQIFSEGLSPKDIIKIKSVPILYKK